ncbi:hypothetical protein CHUAL_004868 [Chamberlinius hualienensis]
MLLRLFIIFYALLTVEGINNGCLHPDRSTHVLAKMSKNHENGIFPVDTKITYSCDSEYDILNQESRVCLPNGAWTGFEPYCGLNVAATGKVHNITIYDPNNISFITVHQYDNGIVNGLYSECTVIRIKEAIFFIELNKTYTIDLIKLAFKNPNVSEGYPNPTVHYSSLNIGNWKNVTLLKNYTETVQGDYFSTFQYIVNSSVKSRFVILKLGWPREGGFSLCDVSIYTKTDLPESWCSFNSDPNVKHFSFESQCFAIFPFFKRVEWKEALKLCNEYKRELNSSLMKKPSNNPNGFYAYIKSTIAFTRFDQSHFWFINPEDTKQCYSLKLSQIPNSDDITCNSDSGRICQYNWHRCGTPDQIAGSVINFNETIANYSCPVNYVLIGNITRTCFNGRWTLNAPKCVKCNADNTCLDNCKAWASRLQNISLNFRCIFTSKISN